MSGDGPVHISEPLARLMAGVASEWDENFARRFVEELAEPGHRRRLADEMQASATGAHPHLATPLAGRGIVGAINERTPAGVPTGEGSCKRSEPYREARRPFFVRACNAGKP